MLIETRNPYAGPLTAADLEREPGPQTSKASPETWRATDRAIYAMLAWAIVTIAVLGFVHIVATNGA